MSVEALDTVMQDLSDETQSLDNVSEIPKKFEGKSSEEVVKAYLNLEKDHGRLANEVGELRKYTDRLLELQLQEKADTGKQDSQEPEFDSADFLDNPEKVIERLVEKRVNEKLKPLEENLQNRTNQDAQRVFQDKHPDYNEVATSPEFSTWLNKSTYRLQLLQKAQQSNDYAAADELLVGFKESQPSGDSEDETTISRKQQLKDATFEKHGAGGSSKKIYSRTDLINLRIHNPDKYYDPSFQAAIKKAYTEGRVK